MDVEAKMKITMIVTDLDGTLLREDKIVSERTKDTLKLCMEAKIKIIFATGRGENASQIVPIYLFDGSVFNNGALALVGNDIVYSRFIKPEIIEPLLDVCKKFDLEYGFSMHGSKVGKFWTFGCTPEISTLIEVRLNNDFYLTVSRDGLGQIMHRDATKSKGVAALAQYWGIANSEILVFGDDLNDIDMLSYAGVSVAMGNALNDVKVVADYVCDTNDNDGIAKWLEKNVL
jgi:hydroxymethylpyrimidine pyrophosphatase-like HAD family hydrolase